MTTKHYRHRAGSARSDASKLISAATVTDEDGRERVRLWSRGDFAGELLVDADDGAQLCDLVFRLEFEREEP